MVAFKNSVVFSIVVPSGATTGQRIVIDGVAGVIDIYDSSNNLVAQMGNGIPLIINEGSFQMSIQPNAGGGGWPGIQWTQIGSLNQAYLNVVSSPNNVPELGLNSGLSADPTQKRSILFLQEDNIDLMIKDNANNTYGWINLHSAPAPTIELNLSKFFTMELWVQGDPQSYAVLGVANETWHAMPYNANWGNLGSPWGNGEYIRTALGTVRFSGAAQWLNGVTAAPVPIFTLPVGYRPNRMLHIAVPSMPAVAITPQMETLEILTSGVVQLTNYPAGGPVTPISFENVEFSVNN